MGMDKDVLFRAGRKTLKGVGIGFAILMAIMVLIGIAVDEKETPVQKAQQVAFFMAFSATAWAVVKCPTLPWRQVSPALRYWLRRRVTWVAAGGAVVSALSSRSVEEVGPNVFAWLVGTVVIFLYLETRKFREMRNKTEPRYQGPAPSSAWSQVGSGIELTARLILKAAWWMMVICTFGLIFLLGSTTRSRRRSPKGTNIYKNWGG